MLIMIPYLRLGVLCWVGEVISVIDGLFLEGGESQLSHPSSSEEGDEEGEDMSIVWRGSGGEMICA